MKKIEVIFERDDSQSYLYKKFTHLWARDSVNDLLEVCVYSHVMPIHIPELKSDGREFLKEVYEARKDKAYDMDGAVKKLLGDCVCNLKNYPFSNPGWLSNLIERFEVSDAEIEKYINEWDKYYLCSDTYEKIGNCVRTGTLKEPIGFIEAVSYMRCLENEAISYALQTVKCNPNQPTVQGG